MVVLPTLAGPEENARVVAGRGLARLHIEMIGVQGRFTRYGYYVECKEAPLARDESRWKWRDKQDDRDAPGL